MKRYAFRPAGGGYIYTERAIDDRDLFFKLHDMMDPRRVEFRSIEADVADDREKLNALGRIPGGWRRFPSSERFA